MLVLLLQAGSVEAQTVTITGGSPYTIAAVNFNKTCGDVTGLISGTSSYHNLFNPITITSSSPVNSMTILVASLGQGGLETHSFNASGITNEVVSVSTECSGILTVSGNNVSNVVASDGVGTRITVSSVTPFTQVVIATPVVGAAMMVVSAFVCKAGATAPTLSATTKTNTCPSATLDLNSLVTSTLPSGATLKWFSDNTHTTEVTTPTAVSASGTYYAFYVDTVNNCYSPASAAVTATVTLCPLNISNTCPSPSVDLALSHQGTVPNGYTLTFHSGTPATDANKITNPVTASGTYYGAYYFAGQSCYSATGGPLVVTITNCCAAQTLPDLTN